MTDKVREAVCKLINEFAGKQPFTGDSMLGADLHIYGSDSVEFLDKLENLFSVDLRPLVERGPLERTGFWSRMFGVTPRPSGVDISVNELIDFIDRERRRSED